MPYRRSYRRRYGRRRKRFYRKDTVKKVRRTVRKLQRKVETKTFVNYHEFGTVSAVPEGVVTLQPEFVADQGAASDQFIGRKYHAVGVQVIVSMTKQTTGQVSNLRLVGIWVKGGPSLNGVISYADFFESVDENGTTIPQYIAPFRTSAVSAAKLLWDYKWPMGVKTGATNQAFAAGPQTRFLRFYRGINADVTFNMQFSEYQKGRLIMFAVDQFAGETDLRVLTKFYYKDP